MKTAENRFFDESEFEFRWRYFGYAANGNFFNLLKRLLHQRFIVAGNLNHSFCIQYLHRGRLSPEIKNIILLPLTFEKIFFHAFRKTGSNY